MLDGNGIAQIHGSVDVGEALALGDTGQQSLNGAQELVGIDAQCGKGRAVGHDVLRLLGLFAGKVGLAGIDVLRQHLLQLRYLAGVVQSAHGNRAEIGGGKLFQKFL